MQVVFIAQKYHFAEILLKNDSYLLLLNVPSSRHINHMGA